MVNNIELIKPLLIFESEDDFYFIQIIKRKKEHPELGSNSYIVKTYYINSIESLDRNFPEMICLAEFHNARVGITLNKRSYEKLAFHNLKKVTDQIMNKDFRSVRKSYNSVCGTYSSDSNKKWILDIDVIDFKLVNKVEKYINNLLPEGNKTVAILPTKNGYHLITKPFDMRQFPANSFGTEIAIHKDNPSILYIP